MGGRSESITIRAAVAADAAAWLRLRIELWPNEDGGDLERDVAAYFAGAASRLQHVLVAEGPGGALVGFAELNLRPYAEGCSSSPVAYLEGWFVVETHRRGGVGASLVHAAERWARAMDCSEFASDALASNDVSAAAHRALGFEEVEAIRCFRKRLES